MSDVTAAHHSDDALALELYPLLRRFAAVVAPPEVAPDDLVHDALVATLGRGPLNRLDEPAAYLRRSMLNLASNHRRRFGRGRRSAGRLAATVLVEASADHYPSDLAQLAALRPTARAVLYLHHVEGYSLDAVAELLHLRPASVRQVATRARRQLRIDMEADR